MKSADRFLVYPCLVVLAASAAFPQKKRPALTGSEGTFRHLQIVDEKGRMRVELGIDADGAAFVATMDENGKDRVVLTQTDDDKGGMVRTYGPEGKERARIGGAKNGTGTFEAFGVDGKVRLRFTDGEKGASLEVYGPGEKPRVQLGGWKEIGQVVLWTADENPRVVLSATAPGGILETRRADGKTVWSSPKP